MFAGELGKKMMIQQGYVPATCTLPVELAGTLIWSEINAGRDVCAGCEADRSVCKGRPKKPNAPDQARAGSPSPEAGCSASPFALRAADKMAAIIDEMVSDGQLNSRSRLADARLDYGEPWTYAHTPNKVISKGDN